MIIKFSVSKSPANLAAKEMAKLVRNIAQKNSMARGIIISREVIKWFLDVR